MIGHIVAIMLNNDIDSLDDNDVLFSEERSDLNNYKSKLTSVEVFGSYNRNLTYIFTRSSFVLFPINPSYRLVSLVLPRKKNLLKKYERSSNDYKAGFLISFLTLKHNLDNDSQAIIYGTDNLQSFQTYNLNINEFPFGNAIKNITELPKFIVNINSYSNQKCLLYDIQETSAKISNPYTITYHYTQYLGPSNAMYLDLQPNYFHLFNNNNTIVYKLKGRLYIYYYRSYDTYKNQEKAILTNTTISTENNQVFQAINEFIINTNNTPVLLSTPNFNNDILNELQTNNNYSIIFVSDKFDWSQYEKIIQLRENSFYIKVFATNKNVLYPSEPIDKSWISSLVSLDTTNTKLIALKKDISIPIDFVYLDTNGVLRVISSNDFSNILSNLSDINKYTHIIFENNYRYYVFRLPEHIKAFIETEENKRYIEGYVEQIETFRMSATNTTGVYLAIAEQIDPNDLDISIHLYKKRINNLTLQQFVKQLVLSFDPYISYYEPKARLLGNNLNTSLGFLLKKAELYMNAINSPTISFPIKELKHQYSSYFVDNSSIDYSLIMEIKKMGLNIIFPNFDYLPLTAFAGIDIEDIRSDQQVMMQVVYLCYLQYTRFRKLTRKGNFNDVAAKKTLEQIKQIAGKKGIILEKVDYYFDSDLLTLFINNKIRVKKGIYTITFEFQIPVI